MQRRDMLERLYQMTKPFPLDPYPLGHKDPPPEWNQEEEWDED